MTIIIKITIIITTTIIIITIITIAIIIITVTIIIITITIIVIIITTTTTIIIIIHLVPARRPDFIIINKRKRICKIVDFAVPADHRINLKETEKKNKYLDPARELKKLWNMKVTIVQIVIGALGTVTNGLLKGLED